MAYKQVSFKTSRIIGLDWLFRRFQHRKDARTFFPINLDEQFRSQNQLTYSHVKSSLNKQVRASESAFLF